MISTSTGDIRDAGSRPSGPSAAWAVALLLILAFFDGVLLAVLLLAGGPVGTGFRILSAIGIATALAVALIVAVGLTHERRWARPAAAGVMWLLVASGAIEVVSSLRDGRLTIPFLAIGALLILVSWRRSSGDANASSRLMSARDRVASVALVAGFALPILVWPGLVNWLAIPGHSPLAVAPGTVDVDAAVDCQAVRRAVSDPASRATPIPASLSWRWSQHEFLPGGTDSLAIRWAAVDEADPDKSNPGISAFFLAEAPGFRSTGESSTVDTFLDSPFSVGLSTDQTTIADRLADANALGQGFAAAIDLEQQGLRDDRLDFVLQAGDDPPLHGSLEVRGYYIHHNTWRTAPAIASCSW